MALVFTSDEDLNPSWMTNPYRAAPAESEKRWRLWQLAQKREASYLRGCPKHIPATQEQIYCQQAFDDLSIPPATILWDDPPDEGK